MMSPRQNILSIIVPRRILGWTRSAAAAVAMAVPNDTNNMVASRIIINTDSAGVFLRLSSFSAPTSTPCAYKYSPRPLAVWSETA